MDNSCYDFMGTAAHELGHAGGLWDLTELSDPPCQTMVGGARNTNHWTMCQTPNSTGTLWVTYYKRTLTTDDQNSMAELYP